jgi:nucleoside-diphosphate-sugar epimerase
LENVLDISKDSGIHIIYFSSSMVYGNFDGAAVEEDRQCNPIGIYGALKYGAEKLVLAYNQVFSLPYTIIRPSALYGERCVSRRVGQAFIENALLGKTLTINGDGKDALDFTYIEDLIQGVILAIINKNAINETFNITYGNGRQFIELAEIVKSEFEKLDIKFNPRDGLMPERGTLSIEKAKNLLGYKPTFSIDIGYKNYINWYRSFAISYPEYFEQKNSTYGL